MRFKLIGVDAIHEFLEAQNLHGGSSAEDGLCRHLAAEEPDDEHGDRNSPPVTSRRIKERDPSEILAEDNGMAIATAATNT